jgi:DNA invertase Pin-like site-specific DNA recombinase
MKIGYARVSTDAQETHLQMDALKRVKCTRIYEGEGFGGQDRTAGIDEALG